MLLSEKTLNETSCITQPLVWGGFPSYIADACSKYINNNANTDDENEQEVLDIYKRCIEHALDTDQFNNAVEAFLNALDIPQTIHDAGLEIYLEDR